MDLSVIADWCTILFFLWYGLKTFFPALGKNMYAKVGGALALAAAVFTLLST